MCIELNMSIQVGLKHRKQKMLFICSCSVWVFCVLECPLRWMLKYWANSTCLLYIEAIPTITFISDIFQAGFNRKYLFLIIGMYLTCSQPSFTKLFFSNSQNRHEWYGNIGLRVKFRCCWIFKWNGHMAWLNGGQRLKSILVPSHKYIWHVTRSTPCDNGLMHIAVFLSFPYQYSCTFFALVVKPCVTQSKCLLFVYTFLMDLSFIRLV